MLKFSSSRKLRFFIRKILRTFCHFMYFADTSSIIQHRPLYIFLLVLPTLA